jgi:DNA-binding transcriptional regulator GbsR (MarR family)
MLQELTEAQSDFVEDMGRLLASWGVPLTTGRLYGYLLLNEAPVSLDDVARVLQISKSGASVAARQLELYRLARRIGQRGSRRVLYEVMSDFDRVLEAETTVIRRMLELYRAGARAASSETVRRRLDETAELYDALETEIEALVERWRSRREAT